MSHTCHWPNCNVPVPPAMWGCKRHWFTLPKPLRDRIWATYKPGQEISKTPSSEYLDAAAAVQSWIREYLGRFNRKPGGEVIDKETGEITRV